MAPATDGGGWLGKGRCRRITTAGLLFDDAAPTASRAGPTRYAALPPVVPIALGPSNSPGAAERSGGDTWTRAPLGGEGAMRALGAAAARSDGGDGRQRGWAACGWEETRPRTAARAIDGWPRWRWTGVRGGDGGCVGGGRWAAAARGRRPSWHGSVAHAPRPRMARAARRLARGFAHACLCAAGGACVPGRLSPAVPVDVRRWVCGGGCAAAD